MPNHHQKIIIHIQSEDKSSTLRVNFWVKVSGLLQQPDGSRQHTNWRESKSQSSTIYHHHFTPRLNTDSPPPPHTHPRQVKPHANQRDSGSGAITEGNYHIPKSSPTPSWASTQASYGRTSSIPVWENESLMYQLNKMGQKAERLTHFPYLNNTAYYTLSLSQMTVHEGTGPFLMIQSWIVQTSIREP